MDDPWSLFLVSTQPNEPSIDLDWRPFVPLWYHVKQCGPLSAQPKKGGGGKEEREREGGKRRRKEKDHHAVAVSADAKDHGFPVFPSFLATFSLALPPHKGGGSKRRRPPPPKQHFLSVGSPAREREAPAAVKGRN